jgi:saccharopine dehydrogenase-like NADP-dependent oxidoreductase
MKRILILGAGLSSRALIDYFLERSGELGIKVRVGDISLDIAITGIDNRPSATAFEFDVNNSDQLNREVTNSDIVISMLPARFHHLVAIG